MLALGGDGRGADRGVHEPVALGLGPGVHELGEDLGAGGVDRVDDHGPGARLLPGGDAGLEQVALAVGRVGVDALGDQQPEASAGEGLVVGHHPVRDEPVPGGADAGHGGQRDAVGELGGADPDG